LGLREYSLHSLEEALYLSAGIYARVTVRYQTRTIGYVRKNAMIRQLRNSSKKATKTARRQATLEWENKKPQQFC